MTNHRSRQKLSEVFRKVFIPRDYSVGCGVKFQDKIPTELEASREILKPFEPLNINAHEDEPSCILML